MKSSRPILKLNVPTLLTLSRIVLIPLFLYVAADSNFWGAIIFSIASITDFLDGYIARRTGQVTTFGVIMDPIADKFMVITALFMLVYMGRLSVLIAVIITAREFLITALRVVALTMDIVIKAEMGGKLKTTAQITAIICLLLGWDVFGTGIDLFDVGTVAIWIALVLAVVSGIQYTVGFWRKMQEMN